MNTDFRQLAQSIVGAIALHDAKQHAARLYPQESCGFIASGVYVPCENVAADPATDFEIRDERLNQAIIDGTLQFIVHSHPDAPLYPSANDMRQQIALGVPWVIIQINETQFGEIAIWGDTLPIAPIIGRPFIHGIFDCYSCLRDAFRLGKDGLARFEIDWPHDPIVLPEVPRDDSWWKEGGDLYRDHFAKFGFREISRSEARPGDVFLMTIPHQVSNPLRRINHGGVIIDGDQILHHLSGRLSRREPMGYWRRAVDLWIRYEGQSLVSSDE